MAMRALSSPAADLVRYRAILNIGVVCVVFAAAAACDRATAADDIEHVSGAADAASPRAAPEESGAPVDATIAIFDAGPPCTGDGGDAQAVRP